MLLSLKERLFSHAGFWRVACVVGFSCLFIICFLIDESMREYDRAIASYRQTSHLQALEVKNDIEKAFEQIYSNIRTIAKLPSVRNIDRHAKTLSPSDKTAIQEIYNNLADDVSVSEVYVVPQEFNPDAKDKITGKLEVPAISFDGLIVGHTGDVIVFLI